MRALEVMELTGGLFTARMPAFESIYPAVQIALEHPDLEERVRLRVQRMMAGGLLAEVRRLLPLGLRDSPTAGKALGYQQLLAVLDEHGELRGDLGAGRRADRAPDLAVRAPAAVLVPPGSAAALAGRGGPRPAGQGAGAAAPLGSRL